LADSEGNTQAWLAPGARLPLVYAGTTILFTAGPTTYEINLVNPDPTFAPAKAEPVHVGDTTIGPVALTESQHLLVLALAEPVLSGRGSAAIPTSAQAAEVGIDRKSTRLNSSHVKISYAVFCLKKKKNDQNRRNHLQNMKNTK